MTSLMRPTKADQGSGPTPTKVFGITIGGGGRPTKATAAGTSLVIGGEPRTHLLPPEVRERKRGKEIRRRLGFGVIGVLVLVGAGYGYATLTQISAQSQLATVQAQTASLLQQQAKYNQVTKVKADQDAIIASQKLATAQEISWKPYVAAIEANLPAGAVLTGFGGSIDTPFQQATVSTDPLVGTHIATLKISVTMSQASIAGWLNTLPTLTGFVDATPDSVALAQSGGAYDVAVTIHLDSKALLGRYTKTSEASK